jgi:hypothetical protein
MLVIFTSTFLILLEIKKKVKKEEYHEQKPSICVYVVWVCEGENYMKLRCERTLSSTFTHVQGQAI